MEQAIAVLRECKESIINTYALKTGISRAKISRLMSDETWMNARKAVELGFADKILYTDETAEKMMFWIHYLRTQGCVNSLSKAVKAKPPQPNPNLSCAGG